MPPRMFLASRATGKIEFELLDYQPEFTMALLRERSGDEYWTTLPLHRTWVRERYKLKRVESTN